MHFLLSDKPETRLLLGNEAIVRGALEAGVGFFSTYPGTPSSEIGDTFFRLHQEAGIGFEYSVNEKVALEVAGAAAAAGVRTLVAMKHVGVNVAADPLMTLSYIGVRGGLVLVSADDPGCHSSQNEQDNRHYARLAKLPMIEPATPQQAYAFIQEAFELSERHQTPVILRTTTRVSHTRAPIAFGQLIERKPKGFFVGDKRRFTPVPAVARLRHPVVEENIKKIELEYEKSEMNQAWGEGNLGILTSGVSACYVEDMVRRLELQDRVHVLHLGTTFPMPRKLLSDFVKRVDSALVVEELDPILENELRLAVTRVGKLIPIFGKETGHFSLLGELGPDEVGQALAEVAGLDSNLPAQAKSLSLPQRPPILCPGCPHRATYYAVKMAVGDEAMYLSDIGCYTLGFLPPIGMGDYFICMGSSASSAGGFAATIDKPVVSFIGDSTFFHSGITGMINSVHNQRDLLLVVMDNSTTGMTGHQPHPGTDIGGLYKVDIEAMAHAAGVKHVAKIDPMNFRASLRTINELLAKDGPKVLISQSPCPLFAKKAIGQKRKTVKYTVDADKCMVCGRSDSPFFCNLNPQKDYALTRSRTRIETGPMEFASFTDSAPAKMEHPPCESACPLGLCVQGYVTYVAAGQIDQARTIIRQRLALPHSICRVCTHPCETECIRADVDEPIAINQIKRFVMDAETKEDRAKYITHLREMIRNNGRKVAIIGAGPAGLGCAFDLRYRGYQVTIFEASHEAGGMLSYGIPRHRLPREALQKDIDVIEGLGVEIQFNRLFGKDLAIADLRAQGFDAVFVSPGMTAGARLGVDGESLPGVVDAMGFLHQVNLEGLNRIGQRVIVVGGGNAAIDAARCALRLGAEKVMLLYRRTRDEMPAIDHEIIAALAEGVVLHELAMPEKVESDGASLRVLCRRMQLGETDSDGRRKPVPTDESFVLPCDLMITAIGQQSAFIGDSLPGVNRDRWGRIEIDLATGSTNDPFIFAGGDAVTGPASVVEALQSGKFAAYGIDKALADDPHKVILELPRDRKELLAEPRYRPVEVEEQARRQAPMILPAEAIASFNEVESVFSESDVVAEAKRCLTCGFCAACSNCLTSFGCPAFFKEGGKVQINPILCDGCGTCVQICPNGAIVPVLDPTGGDA